MSFHSLTVYLASSHGADSEQVGGVLVALAGMEAEEHGLGEREGLKGGRERDSLTDAVFLARFSRGVVAESTFHLLYGTWETS